MRNYDYKLVRPEDECECGRPAAIYQSGYKNCLVCRDLQRAANAMEAKRMTAGIHDGERSTLRLFKEFNPLEHIFTPRIFENGGGIVVQGHGEYFIPINHAA